RRLRRDRRRDRFGGTYLAQDAVFRAQGDSQARSTRARLGVRGARISRRGVPCGGHLRRATRSPEEDAVKPVLITAARVGAETTREQTPYLPITAEEIGEEARKCREAGAAMVHLHVREPDGRPSQKKELFAAAIAAVRERCDVLVQVSTGG